MYQMLVEISPVALVAAVSVAALGLAIQTKVAPGVAILLALFMGATVAIVAGV